MSELKNWSVREGHCEDCPIAITEGGEQGINLGCLPCGSDVIQFAEEGRLWHCHSNSERPCPAAVALLKDFGFNIHTLSPMTIKEFTRGN